MASTQQNNWTKYLVFGLSVFLIFILLFESQIEPPQFVKWMGRWHPLILHFPIVLLLIAIYINFTQKRISHLLLTVAVLSTLATAISGFFLGLDSEQKGGLLYWHQWLGTGVALLAVLWYWLDGKNYGQHIGVKGIHLVLVAFIIFTGHYGGMITHGEDFLAFKKEGEFEKIPENPLVYEHIVARILKQNCVSCHNPNKQKGQLLMTSYEELLEGGETGKSFSFENPKESELIRRLYLPEEDEEHMPPEGKKPLTEKEIKILEEWAMLGASDTLRLNHLASDEPLAVLINEMMAPDPMEKWAKLPKVQDSTLLNLSSDYLTIKRMAGSTEALRINVYKPPQYDPMLILGLKPIAMNIVELDISKLPIGEEEIKMIGSFSNLEWLEIDQIALNDNHIQHLGNLAKLQLLKIYKTDLTDKSISILKSLKALRNLYVWDTGISTQALSELKTSNPALLIEAGIEKELKEYFISSKDSISKDSIGIDLEKKK